MVLVASRCLLSLQQPKRYAKLHVLPYLCQFFFCVSFSVVSNYRLRGFDFCYVRKTHPLPSYRFQVLLQLLLDHLVGYFYGFVLGGLTISDGVRQTLTVIDMCVLLSNQFTVKAGPQCPFSQSTMSARAIRQFAATSSRTLSLRSSLIPTRARVPAFSPLSRALPATRAAFSISARRFGEGTSAC